MKSGRLFELNGSPSYPSPLESRAGKRERAAQFGLTDENEESFECNQSFPRALYANSKFKQNVNYFSPDITHLRGYELNSVNFLKKNLIKNLNSSLSYHSQQQKKRLMLNDTLPNKTNTMNTSCYGSGSNFDKSWAFYNQFMNNNTSMQVGNVDFNDIVAVSNPNKALVVINGRTTEILTANNISCDLFGYNETRLIGMKLKDLLDLDGSQDFNTQQILMETDRLDKNGRIVLCSGKIFDAIINNEDEEDEDESEDISQEKTSNLVMPISMYMLKLTDEKEPKCLCVMEPIQRVIGKFSINLKGRIRYYNSNFSYIFGYTSMNTASSGSNAPNSLSSMSASSILNGKDINELIPSMKLPMSAILPDIRRQALTGRSCHGENIPLTVNILSKQLFNSEEIVYNCTVIVYTNISGLVTVRPSDFTINSCNSTFSRLLFGHDEVDLLNKPITYLIPNFFDPADSSSQLNSAKPTPLRVNNSYLNASSKQINNKNGSFIETRASNQMSTTTPHKTKDVPQFVITDVGDESNKSDNSNSTYKHRHQQQQSCSNCKKSKSNNKKDNIMADFHLNEDLDIYSPNKKCVNFIETNNFSYYQSSGSPSNSPTSSPGGPLSNKQKSSLLAKAINNNFDCKKIPSSDVSISSNNSSMSSLCSLQNSSCSNLDVSSCDTDSLNDQEFDESFNYLCDNCLVSTKPTKTPSKNHHQHDDNSEVSLIGMDSDHEDVDEDEDLTEEDDSDKKHIVNKRKASQTSTGTVNADRNTDQSQPNSQLQLQQSNNSNMLNNKKFKNQVTSTPAALSNVNLMNQSNSSSMAKLKITNNDKSRLSNRISPSNKMNANDGMFFGSGRHIDGSLIRIFYQRKLVRLNNEYFKNDTEDDQSFMNKSTHSQSLICVWISRDPYADKSIIECSMDQSQMFKINRTLNQTNTESNYLAEYEDVRTLGRGASGFVQLARRKLDKFEVVTKYIFKSKIYKENWINDERYGNIPLEISILCKLDHENIIKVLEVFQDTDHVQMIMEKHGCGMDLFEFIDRQRKYMEEPLACHIFRQIVSAVSYLHSNSIVHRDIKDENIVINEKFHIKLIDFGSAAYVTKGKKFATFCGTMDYCSPDVLLGNKYYGPELDVWTLGIALYTLVFSENPFLDAEETIECVLKPPFRVSKELMKLLFAVLCPKPEQRATITEIEKNPWVTQQVDILKYKWEEVIRDTEFHSNNAGDINLNQQDLAQQNDIQADDDIADNNENIISIDAKNPEVIIKSNMLMVNNGILSKSF